tara:strand:- start:82 stop:318 length:237 start_codon:yes stop_codon:yes gene_type:complete
MRDSEFKKVKRVDYLAYSRKVSLEFESLKNTLRANGASKEAIDEARIFYLSTMGTLEDIRKDNNRINKLTWHLANLRR